jgi:predicted acetyltransferase
MPMPVIDSPDVALDSAYQGLEEVARDLIPPQVVADFAEIRLGFALMKQQLGMELTFDNKLDLSLGEFRHGVPAAQLGAVWQQRQDVAQAVAGVRQHATALGDRPEWKRIENIYESARGLGVAIQRQLGAHSAKVLADPRSKRALKTVADLATRRIAADAWALSKVLGGAGAGLTKVRQAVQWLEKTAKAGAARVEEESHQPAKRRAAAAALRSSTGGTPSRSPAPAKSQAARPEAVHRTREKVKAAATV